MKISTHFDGRLPRTVSDSVEHFAQSRLSRFGSAVREVRATLLDLNGPKGGNDMRCRLNVRLQRGGRMILIEETAGTVREALGNAFDRASYAISRQLDRRQKPKRGIGARRLAAAT